MRFETLKQWLSWQEGLHPSEIELGLTRVRQVLERMGRQVPAAKVITVAGTNGKGSCCAMLEAIYLAAGYRVGLYTSPHLIQYNERVRINGEQVSDEVLCRAFHTIDEARGDISITYFEFGTLAAIEAFANVELDVIILEVGLGGRLDAVNIIDADVALIAAISLDHADWLGTDVELIGREKAGIMRAGRPAVCADPAPPQSISTVAEEVGADLYRLGHEFSFIKQDTQWQWHGPGKQRPALPPPGLRGAFQYNNAAAVVAVVQLLAAHLPVGQTQLRAGLSQAQLAGRFQVINAEVPLILDVAHNPQAADGLRQNLRAWPTPGQTHAVLGMMADKDIVESLKPLLTEVDAWYLTALETSRAASTSQLAAVLAELGVTAPVTQYPNVEQALTAARKGRDTNDRVLVFGSFYTVAGAAAAAYNAH